MKRLIIVCICSMALVTGLFAQTPTASPAASSPAAPAAAAAAVPPATTAPATEPENEIEQAIRRKVNRELKIAIDDHETHPGHRKWDEDIPPTVLPLVGIVFLTVFGAPVLIVIMIGLFALLVSRSRQRTIRMMLEKGQPVPAELLAPHTRAAGQRSDVRRGVVWMMVGLGLMLWLGAVNGWEGGAWSFGLIPFLIGLGYLMVWKLEGKRDVPPPPPGP